MPACSGLSPVKEINSTYDYIIAGTGCAGLSLAVQMIRSGQFANKKILLVDKETKQHNDRTWCFWENKPGPFEEIVYSRWEKTWFRSPSFEGLLELWPYEYKLIRGIDFYQYCLKLIRKQDNFEILQASIDQVQSDANGTYLLADGKKISAQYIFSSIPVEAATGKKQPYKLLQHFKGWVLETNRPQFNAAEATLMDFRISQQHGTAFVYVMPFSSTRALVEYTLFTRELLKPEQYEEGLKNYLDEFLQVADYRITEEEFGIIPMTNYKFPRSTGNIIHIGTAGGQTKASSGYTFRFIQKHAAALVDQLIRTGKPFLPNSAAPAKYRFYDSVLLHILYHDQLPGREIFADLFKKNKPQPVLRFLDNESSLLDELKIITSLPTWPFLKAALKQF